jgi:hypothetical protein
MVWDMDMCVKHLRALGHPLRLQIIMTLIPGDMYLSEDETRESWSRGYTRSVVGRGSPRPPILHLTALRYPHITRSISTGGGMY